MSMGRLLCHAGDGAEGIVSRVNELLAPWGFKFQPTPISGKMAEELNYLCWDLVRLAPEAAAPAGATVLYRLAARPDVTALELARLLALGGWGLRVPLDAEDGFLRKLSEVRDADNGCAPARHLERVEG